MKVAFIQDPFTVEPLGISYLSSVLKKAGHKTELLRTGPDLENEFLGFRPDVMAISVTTGKHKRMLDLSNRLKRFFNTRAIFGGSHPTYFPEFLQEDGVDSIVRGEAERSILRSFDEPLVSFDMLEQDLDSIEFPDRQFLYKYPENLNNSIKNVITSRGCAFSCPYCFNSIYRCFYKGQRWVRHRSADNVIAECIELKKYPLKFIFFQDDEFLTNPNFEELMEKYASKVRVPFHCQLRIEKLTHDKADILKDAGCKSVTFAIECGDPIMRKEKLNRNMSDFDIIAGANILHDCGIKFRTENMIGLPGESVTQMLTTLDLNIRVKPTLAWTSIFQPYPMLTLGSFTGSVDDFSESFFERPVVKCPKDKQIVNLQRLFGFICSFPILRSIVKLLINIPNNVVYDKLYKAWKQKKYKELFS